jgi:hypothetical protein
MMPSDLMGRITMLEARVSLLERRIRREDHPRATPGKPIKPTAGPISYSVDQPGLIISDAYEIERDPFGRLFCWVGGAERVQFVFPHNADRRQICSVHLVPHPRVDFGRLRVVVNDEGQKHLLVPAADNLMQLRFPVDNVGAPNINVLLLNLHGIRPGEIGENDDSRLLTARFYGAEFIEA